VLKAIPLTAAGKLDRRAAEGLAGAATFGSTRRQI